MARTESDKEDLIQEATALVERAEFCRDAPSPDSCWQMVTVGYRKNGDVSLYFDQDPLYQFNSNGRLRRAWEGGFLYRSETDTLAKLDRQRDDAKTTLHRSDLTSTELAEFRQRMTRLLTDLHVVLSNDSWVCPRQVSVRGDIKERTVTMLNTVLRQDDNFLAGRIAKRKRT